MSDFAEIMGIEFVHINQNTTIEDLKMKLAMGDVIWDWTDAGEFKGTGFKRGISILQNTTSGNAGTYEDEASQGPNVLLPVDHECDKFSLKRVIFLLVTVVAPVTI